MSEALSNFIFQSKYSRYNSALKRKETFEESVERINNMHIEHLSQNYSNALNNSEFISDYLEAIDLYKSKKIFGSQRGLQFGGTPILNKNCRIYNCSATYVDRLEVFKEIEWVLLCGCGVGVSVEKQHIDKLPNFLSNLSSESENYVIEDSIEGWANAIDRIISYYFIEGTKYPIFDYSAIRPNGALISGGFVAPGPEGLKNSINKISDILSKAYKTKKRLSALDISDIIAHEADSVLSGGVRRSALIILFDPDDKEMFNCKTGNWWYTNAQRGRFNMSAVLDRETTDYEVYSDLFQATKEFGEPGFIWRSNDKLVYNPCAEIGLLPTLNGITGWQFCNLISISGKEIESENDFCKICKAAATLATVQASYQSFDFLGKNTELIVQNDPLIGVSIGGVMTNPSILLDPEILTTGAKIVKEQNYKIAQILGINPSSRCTAIKPDGNFSVLTGNTPGCHGDHAKHYIRRVQVNKEEEAGKIYKKFNPKAVIDSIWSNNNTDYCIMFPVTAVPNSVLKKDLVGIRQLEVVKDLQSYWVRQGSREDCPVGVENNVSNTVQVDNWDEVKQYVFKNRDFFAGISFIPQTGDLDFNQPPYTEVLMPDELLEQYGPGVIFASGLIVDIIKIFGDLWKAYDIYMGKGEKLYHTDEDVKAFLEEYSIVSREDYLDRPLKEYIEAKNKQITNLRELLLKMGYSDELVDLFIDNDVPLPNTEIKKYLDSLMFGQVEKLADKRELIRRLEKFSCKYFECDMEETFRALKHVQLYHDWCDITDSQVEIDWSKVVWKNVLIDANTTASQGCAGGACEISKL